MTGGGNWFAWWKQPADRSTPWLKRTIAVNQTGATNALPAELNGDGVMDIFATRGHDKGVLWFEGPDFKLHEIDSEMVGPHDLAIGDIDSDGDVDGGDLRQGQLCRGLVRERRQGRLHQARNPR